MEYNFTILKTAADCDTVISIAKKEMGNLIFRKDALQRQSITAAETAQEIQAELDSLNAELGYLDPIIASLPDGKYKEDSIARWKKADFRKFILTGRKNNYGVVAAMDKQYDIACIEKMIEETDNFIGAVTTRKNEL